MSNGCSNKSNKPIFYVYIYLNPLNPGVFTYGPDVTFDYEPFYVGKGCGYRAYDHLHQAKKSKNRGRGAHRLNTIRKIWRELNIDPIIIFFEKDIIEWGAFEIEKYLIRIIGRSDRGLGPLTNLTDGGEGFVGKNNSGIYNPNYGNGDKIKGKNNPNYGKSMCGSKNPNFGKKHPGLNKGKVLGPQSPELIEKRISKLRGVPRPEGLIANLLEKSRIARENWTAEDKLKAKRRLQDLAKIKRQSKWIVLKQYIVAYFDNNIFSILNSTLVFKDTGISIYLQKILTQEYFEELPTRWRKINNRLVIELCPKA